MQLEAFSRDCQQWTADTFHNATMEDCWEKKFQLFKMISQNFQKMVNDLKRIIEDSAQKVTTEIENCASNTRVRLEHSWSLINDDIDDTLLN